MAAHVEVVSTDLRRAKVKVTPGTFMVDVLDEACQKLNLKSDKYLLKHKQRTVDLSGPYRTSGLGPGAKLELVQKSSSPSVISIGLDVVGHQRMTKKLPSDMALWQVLRQFETSENGLNLTARGSPKSGDGGQLFWESPVLNIMGREIATLEELQKTLSQYGINNGSVLLRLSFRSTDRPLFEAMEQIGQYFKDIDPSQPREEVAKPAIQVSASAVDETPVNPTPAEQTPQEKPTAKPTSPIVAPTAQTAPSNVDSMDVDGPTTPSVSADPLQPTGVFFAPSSSTPAAAQVREDDSVYEPTIAHAQLRQQQLLARAQNTRLKSDAELAADAAEAAAKLAKITNVSIKVRFPDQTSAQWDVGPEHTGAFLYQAIRGVMAYPDQPFKLVTSGTHVPILDNEKRLIADYRLKGRELRNLVWEDAASAEARKAPFLKGSVASRAQAVIVPDVPNTGLNDDAGPSTGPSKPVKAEKSESSMDSDAIKKKLGKLFKLPGKR